MERIIDSRPGIELMQRVIEEVILTKRAAADAKTPAELVAARKPGSFTTPKVLNRSSPWIVAIIEHLQKIHDSEGFLRCEIPEALVTSAPEIPSVPPHDFLG
jgi:hypothetical protein